MARDRADEQAVAWAGGDAPVSRSAFERAFGEPLDRLLDLDTWTSGEDLNVLYGRLRDAVHDAVAQEQRIHGGIRRAILPRLADFHGPPEAGVFRASVADLERIHRGLLFRGAVEACDGSYQAHDTLPLTVAQVGVCLVSYRGDQGSWIQRLYRRDLRVAGTLDPVDEAQAMLERRQQPPAHALDEEDRRRQLSRLAQRGLMSYAERAALLHRSSAPWRMGHGSPVPVELLTGAGSMDLLDAALILVRELVLGHQRIVFVPSAPPEEAMLTIGGALHPLEYAIVDTLEGRLRRIVEASSTYDSLHRAAVLAFVREVGPHLVLGLYRASAAAPPYLFYAHRAHCHEAALIALADSTLQEHRGFPLLIDLADTLCKATFGAGAFAPLVQEAYAGLDAPFRYLKERETRYG